MTKSNMYQLSAYQWNPFVGCNFGCVYCKNSFQAQLKRWAKKNCQKCYNFEPHEHPERLNQSLPKTGYMQFIFTCSMGDISFCSTAYLEKIVDRIRREPDKTFLIQSKNPKTFARIDWPDNVILGTTLETNCGGMYKFHKISKALLPVERYVNFMEIQHPLKMITVEPALDFDVAILRYRIEELKPCMVWIGYDTKKNNLPEPPIEKVQQLHWKLSKLGIPVILKQLREFPGAEIGV